MQPVSLLCLLVLILPLVGCGAKGTDDAAPKNDATAATTSPSHHGTGELPSGEALKELPADGGKHYNRLVFASSPYLRQHATNPVDWYPWGETAFEKAQRENKPVFLSIGYSTCHWCHVMARESFSDPEVAEIMNQHFVSVKLDREERPDIDHIYMTAAQVTRGGGGWPLSVFMTPDKKPFFIGTYFPKEGQLGRPGFMDILNRTADAWKKHRGQIAQQAQQVMQAVDRVSQGGKGEMPGKEVLEAGVEKLRQQFDNKHGGFGKAPKFPSPHNLRYLLRRHARNPDGQALAMVRKTLLAMRQGGVYDQVGYGFHRYATDREWLLPHFEKMLYDQALLLLTYAEAYKATGDERFAETAREIVTYVQRDLTAPDGTFYSAESSESEGEEGKFYVWTKQQVLDAVADDEAARLYMDVYNFTDAGNYREEASGKRTGANIPHLQAPLSVIAERHDLPVDKLRRKLEPVRQQLFAARDQRVHPPLDDKVLTDWNGLMIAALARAGILLDEPNFVQAAETAAEALLDKVGRDNHRLHKRYRNGEAGLPAVLGDYAYLAWGMLNLYEATFEVRHLHRGRDLIERMITDFGADNGGFYLTASDTEGVPLRTRDMQDGARPSGNSVAAMNLLRLYRMTGDNRYAKQAEGVFTTVGNLLTSYPTAHMHLLQALDFTVGPSYEVVLSGDPDSEAGQSMLAALRRPFLPHKVVLWRRPTGNLPEIADFTETMGTMDGQPTAYVCRQFTCERPTTASAVMLDNLGVK